MNKPIIIIMLLSLFFNAPLQVKAQTEKGKFLLGGNYGLNYSSNKQTYKKDNVSNDWRKTRALGITPQLGYFLLDNFPVGLEFIYDYKYSGIAKNNYSFSSSLAFLPFLRYYVGGNKIKPFIHTAVGPGLKKDVTREGDFPRSIYNSKLLIFELKGGIGIFLNEQVSVDISFGYHSNTEYHKEPMVDGTFDKWRLVSKGTVAAIGLMIYL